MLIFISRNAEVIDMFLFIVLKKCGIPIPNTILFAQYYEGSHGNRHFIWRENLDSDEHLTERNDVIDSVTKMLPKYFYIKTKCVD